MCDSRLVFMLPLLGMLAGCSADGRSPAEPGDAPADLKAVPIPPNASPGGKSLSAWAAAWWQWALGTPVTHHPILDPTGADCAEGQRGHVWFLAGSFDGSPVRRSCTVPPGTALVVPLINNAYFAFLSDPAETRTEEFVRSQVTCVEDAAFPLLEIDGRPVGDPARFLERSTLFDVQLPADNLFGATEADIPELLLSPSADEGFYLYLPPFAPGTHTVRWRAGSVACGFGQDVAYDITVQPGADRRTP